MDRPAVPEFEADAEAAQGAAEELYFVLRGWRKPSGQFVVTALPGNFVTWDPDPRRALARMEFLLSEFGNELDSDFARKEWYAEVWDRMSDAENALFHAVLGRDHPELRRAGHFLYFRSRELV